MDMLLIGLVTGTLLTVAVHAFRRPTDHERALHLWLLSQDAAAEAVNHNPRGSFKELHTAVIHKLKVNPTVPIHRYFILERAARGALVRLGRMDDFYQLTTPPPARPTRRDEEV